MIRIVCISDTHSRHELIEVPDGDVLIHAGDATMAGRPDEIIAFNDWLGSLPHPHKVVIAGNHDLLFDSDPALARSLITNAVYLQDEGAEVAGLKVWGSPWQPWFMGWAFNLQRGDEIRRKWDLIPDGVDVLVTHGPPHRALDEIADGQRVGCEALAEAVARIRPRLHLFGHIHEGHGMLERRGIRFVNAAVCDEEYRLVNRPIVVDL